MREFKVILIGSTKTGKTSIINRYMKQEYSEDFSTTALPVASSKSISKYEYNLTIWDTAGSSAWDSMNRNVYSDTHFVIFVASYDQINSLDEITSNWIYKVHEHMNAEDYCSIIAMNKCDLSSESTKEMVREKAKALGCDVVDVSAKDDISINTLFDRVIELLHEKFPLNVYRISGNVLNTSEYRKNDKLELIKFSKESAPRMIPHNCFEKSYNIQEFYCPSSISKIQSDAFSGCSKLRKFVLEEDSLLKEIEKGAFKGCCIRDFAITKNLDARKCDFTGILTLGKNYGNSYVIENGILMDKTKRTIYGIFCGDAASLCIPNTVDFIQANPFHPCEFDGQIKFEVGNPNFEHFDEFIVSTDSRVLRRHFGNFKETMIPCYIQQIESKCFFDNRFIEHVVFEEASEMREFEKEVFQGSSLTSIVLPDSIESIGERCFHLCEKLDEVELPKSLAVIGDGVFDGSGVKHISFASSKLEKLPNRMFCKSQLTQIVVPRSVVNIGDYCFSGCSNLIEVLFEEGSRIRELGRECFSNSAIESICIPRSLPKLGKYCFMRCNKLRSVLFEPESELTTLEEHCFKETSINKICIPKSVVYIQALCFSSCEDLCELSFEKGAVIKEIDDIFGMYTGNIRASIPESVETINSRFLENISGIEFEDGSPFHVSRSDVYKGSTFIGSFRMPENVEGGNWKDDYREMKHVEFDPEWTGNRLKREMFSESLLEKIVVPKSVTVIEDKCFSNYGHLMVVEFENGSELRKVGNSAFSGSGLERIMIPCYVEEIGCMAFSNCGFLRLVEFEGGIKLNEIKMETFANTSLERIVIPYSVDEIGESAFSNCRSLKNVEFETGINLRKISSSAFAGCAIEMVTMPSSVEEICESVFSDCQSLREIEFETGIPLNKISKETFSSTSLEMFVVPYFVDEICESAFRNCTSLKQLDFESGIRLTKIHENAFSGSGLENIVIPCFVEEICESAFHSCRSLRMVEFEDESKLRVIGVKAFAETELKSIIIPDSVVVIHDQCFHDTGIAECILNEESQLERLGDYVFGTWHNIRNFFIPPKLSVLNGRSLAGIAQVTVSANNPHFSVFDHFLMNRYQTMLYGTLKCKTSSIKIPKNVQVIKEMCFAGRKKLKSVEFEDGSKLEIIEKGAFAETGISRIELPRNLRQIENCFENCQNLSEICFHDDCPLQEIPYFCDINNIILHIPSNVSRIGQGALSHTKEVKISPKNKYLVASDQFIYHRSGELVCQIGDSRTIVIPKAVKRIPTRAFHRSDIVSVQFEEGSLLQEIGPRAFTACRNLRSVSLQNVSHLEKIDEYAFYRCPSLLIEIPRSVKYVGGNAFRGVPSVSIEVGSRSLIAWDGMIMNLYGTTLFGFYGEKRTARFVLDREVKAIGYSCFAEYRGQKFSCEEGCVLQEIGDRAFNMSEFVEIELPSTVVTIGEKCFDLSRLERIQFGAGAKVDMFREATFRKCYIKTIIIPASVTELGCSCFEEVRSLVSVSFEGESSLICIRNNCFYGCANLESFEFNQCKNLRYIYANAFLGTKIFKVILYPGCQFISEFAFEHLCEITVDIEVDTKLLEWSKTRVGDYSIARPCNFYQVCPDFAEIREIGRGSYGVVVLIENKYTSEKYAVKTIGGDKGTYEIVQEIELMKTFKHPCIMSIEGFNHDATQISICMEYASEGTLEDVLSSPPEWFDATHKSIIIIGIVAGMQHVHSNNILHRDLKPANILIDEFYHAKISDFGSARVDSNDITMNVGTPLYMAPEARQTDDWITDKIDVWSFGLIMYQIVEGISTEQLRRRIHHMTFKHAQDRIRDLIECCVDEMPEYRPSFAELIDEFYDLGLNIIEGTDIQKVEQYFDSISLNIA